MQKSMLIKQPDEVGKLPRIISSLDAHSRWIITLSIYSVKSEPKTSKVPEWCRAMKSSDFYAAFLRVASGLVL